MLQAFVDESGSHDGSRHYVMAGHISTVDEWGQFDEEWVGVLRGYGLNVFHMVDLRAVLEVLRASTIILASLTVKTCLSN
jgi:hypothetical protein